jgi:hypothetical protein
MSASLVYLLFRQILQSFCRLSERVGAAEEVCGQPVRHVRWRLAERPTGPGRRSWGEVVVCSGMESPSTRTSPVMSW